MLVNPEAIRCRLYYERRGRVVVSTSAWHAACRGSIPEHALNIRDRASLCLSDETLKAVGPFLSGVYARGIKISHTRE